MCCRSFKLQIFSFSYTKDAVSVRTGSRLPIEECRHARSFKNDPHQWKYLCIEGRCKLVQCYAFSLGKILLMAIYFLPLRVFKWAEPFDLTNTAHSVYDPEAFEKIKSVFRSSYDALKETRNLDCIFSLSESKETATLQEPSD